MWRIEEPPDHDLADIARFLGALNDHSDFFRPDAPVVVARAPGRLDLMGGIADYSGALVLELPLVAATYAAAQLAVEPQISVRSLSAPGIEAALLVAVPLQALASGGQPIGYTAAHALLTADPDHAWIAYVVGCLVVLQRERGLRLDQGLRLLISSELPAGKGVSSSAALEVAVMRALCAIYQIEIAGRELALLCQKVENQVVGAPCGIMDQMTAACGVHDRLLALLCQPAELQEPVALPADIEVWGIDSGIRHAVTAADYGSVRVGAFMGYRMIADLAGLAVTRYPDERVTVEDRLWNGYLANIPPSVWETVYRDNLPPTIDGASFLERYNGTTDEVTRIDVARVYAVRQPTAHPIYEHHRVRLFRAILQSQPLDPERLGLLGELMYQSHASYSACNLGSSGTDRLVELVGAAGPSTGLYGAKITGGGSGGTVAVLARRGSGDSVQDIATHYERETGHRATILGGSSPGAVAFGVLRLRYE